MRQAPTDVIGEQDAGCAVVIRPPRALLQETAVLAEGVEKILSIAYHSHGRDVGAARLCQRGACCGERGARWWGGGGGGLKGLQACGSHAVELGGWTGGRSPPADHSV